MQAKGIRRPAEAERRAFGRAVLESRARRALSQEELAARAGLHRNYVGSWERGELNPTFGSMLRLVRGLDIRLSELLRVYERQLADGPQGR